MSPTVQTLLLGFALLAIFWGASRLMRGAHSLGRAFRIFYLIWFAYCAWHMSVGVRLGHSFVGEIPFLLINFGIPALAAFLIEKKSTSSK